MAGDARDPAGIYFGTNGSSVFASLDDGENWQEIARHLPTMLAVEVLDRGVMVREGCASAKGSKQPWGHSGTSAGTGIGGAPVG